MENGGSLAVDGNEARRWTGRLLMAVILGLAIWNLIVSVIDNVIVPAMGTLMGQDGALPASFTKNYDYPDLFVALLKFCVAGIVAVSINWFFQRGKKRWVRVAETAAVAPPVAAAPAAVEVRPIPPVTPVVRTAPPAAPVPTRVLATMTPVVPAPPRVETPAARPPVAPVPSVVAAKPVPAAAVVLRQEAPMAPAAVVRPAAVPVQAASAKPVVKVEDKKPKKEKQIYYNLVGEPVEVDED